MKVNKSHPTEDDLKQSLWWWHHSRFAFEGRPIFLKPPQYLNDAEWRDWRQDGMERVAHGWELIRRVYPELKWEPFYEIGSYIAVNLRARIIPKNERVRFAMKRTTEISPDGWTDEDADGWRINLGLTRDALRRLHAMKYLPSQHELDQVAKGSLTVDELLIRLRARKKQLPSNADHLRWIGEQAERRGKQLPRGLVGQHNRPPSWALVEVLDIDRYVATRGNLSRKLTCAERKMKTVATQKARRLLKKYKSALEEIMATPCISQGMASDAIVQDRRRLLGDWEPKTNW
jgi:hypothetical protein